MLIDPISLERVVTAGFLASLAIAVAFGPEIRRIVGRMRNRRATDVSATPSLGAEPQQL